MTKKSKKVDYYAYIKGGTRGIEANPNPPALYELKETENLSDIAFCDRFICKCCGIRLEDWVEVKIDDDGEESIFDYEFKFCPECGAKVKED